MCSPQRQVPAKRRLDCCALPSPAYCSLINDIEGCKNNQVKFAMKFSASELSLVLFFNLVVPMIIACVNQRQSSGFI